MTANASDWVNDRLATIEQLDKPAQRLAELSARQRGPLADLARGAPVGHPIHPALTDLPIGFWTSAVTLDLLGVGRWSAAARALTGLGVLCAVPTVVAGLADLPQLDQRKRRVALVHAASNATATLLFAKSWWSRLRGRTWRGVALGLLASVAATFGGFLGGWLSFGESKPAAVG